MANFLEQIGSRQREGSRGILQDVLRAAPSVFRANRLPPSEMEEIKVGMQRLVETTDLSGAILPGAGALKSVGMRAKAPAARFLKKAKKAAAERWYKRHPELRPKEELLPDVSKWEDLGQALRSSFEFGAEHAKDKALLTEAYAKGLQVKTKVMKMLAKPRTKEASAQMYEEGLRGQFYREVLEGADKALGRPFVDYQGLWRTVIEKGIR